jgi:RNA polymerase sigma-70 factor, ECF subfamily
MAPDLGHRLIELLPRLRRLALALSRSADIADDLVQSACERALAVEDRWTPVLNLEALMFRIVRNLWYDRLRRQRVRGHEVDIEGQVDLVALHADAAPERRLVLSRVAEAIDLLPDDQRDLLILVCVEDVSYRDAAEILELPIGTVMSRLARARRRISDVTGLTGADL